ncbi:RND family transporter [Candidatus Mycobacterium wuenschmannii]|uniref:RND family transporter n=1 Tax=Candidatus Mycobacterium wuenschmannii TaxID=3027808 RepID=A0ABY8VRT0_9MYCO|nr:RND family transporter [Candidatus Mycobacterium wuenschmannii]WIM86344.1 RND family transporter [Candidatus Mycobacterium wuenschmannii]
MTWRSAEKAGIGFDFSDPFARLARFSSRYAVLVVLGWIAVAAVANLAVPQLERVVAAHARSFMPTEAASAVAAKRSAELFGGAPSNNLDYVVLKRGRPLQPVDRQYYDTLVTALRADTQHVYAVTDLWADPITKSAAESRDGRAADLMIRLSGMLGTAEAAASVDVVRATVHRLDPPPGLRVYVTGPGGTLTDEFAAIDHQMLLITAATVLVIMLLLFAVYRSTITAAIPLISVGLALAVARPVIALLGNHGAVEVSLFSVALVAAMILGAGTDYAIFLIGRYQEGRRRGTERATALVVAYRGVAPVVIGSALTMSTALACLSLAEVGMFRSTGIPCAIGVLVSMTAALTLTPALVDLAGRRGMLEPRRSTAGRRWRRIGVVVARWPGPVLVASGALIAVLTLPLAGMRTGWNEPEATPANAESNAGYAAMAQHFPQNRLLPDIVTVETDHDLRNSAGLIAVERITRQVMAIPGVRMVQSASRPAGTVPDEATLSYQAGVIGQRFGDQIDDVVRRLRRVGDLDAILAQMTSAVDQLNRGMQGSAGGLREIGSGADDMRAGIGGIRDNVETMSGYLTPLRNFVNATPNCPDNVICALVSKVVQPVDSVIQSSGELASGADKLRSGARATTTSFGQMPLALQSMRDVLGQARAASTELRGLTDSIGPQVRQVSDYLRELDAGFRGSAAGGFYLPDRALSDPRFRAALNDLVSRDGRVTYLVVYGDGEEWGADGAQRARQIQSAVAEATKEGTVTPTSVGLAGVGPATRDLQGLVHGDVVLLVGATLALIFLIVAMMLRSPVAALAVVGTVIVSFASALGLSVLVSQQLLGKPLHWAVAPMAFIALVAVGADYNLLLAMRIREELGAGIRTGIVRAFSATGGVVTTAGIVFGMTMFALAGSTVLSIEQVGLTVGIGLLLDTLIVRTFLLPSMVVLLGRWFWWPLLPQSAAKSATRRVRSTVSA